MSVRRYKKQLKKIKNIQMMSAMTSDMMFMAGQNSCTQYQKELLDNVTEALQHTTQLKLSAKKILRKLYSVQKKQAHQVRRLILG